MRLGVIICGKEGLIQEGECINVGAGSGSAWPLITSFPNSFTKNRLGCGHHNTKQVTKPKMISDPTWSHLAPDVNSAECGPTHKESKRSCNKTPLGPL